MCTIHSLKVFEQNAECDLKVDYDVILYEVQTSESLHIAVGSLYISAYQGVHPDDAMITKRFDVFLYKN